VGGPITGCTDTHRGGAIWTSPRNQPRPPSCHPVMPGPLEADGLRRSISGRVGKLCTVGHFTAGLGEYRSRDQRLHDCTLANRYGIAKELNDYAMRAKCMHRRRGGTRHVRATAATSTRLHGRDPVVMNTAMGPGSFLALSLVDTVRLSAADTSAPESDSNRCMCSFSYDDFLHRGGGTHVCGPRRLSVTAEVLTTSTQQMYAGPCRSTFPGDSSISAGALTFQFPGLSTTYFR